MKKKEFGATDGRRVNCSAQTQPPPAWPGRAVPELGRKKWEGQKPISIVGSTGFIGTQTDLAFSGQSAYWGIELLHARHREVEVQRKEKIRDKYSQFPMF